MIFKVKLPINETEFDIFVAKVVKKYGLPDLKHAASVISVAIRHLPNDQATTTYRYMGHTVLKNLANYTANFKNEKMNHETQVSALADKLRTDPGDAQARDQLDQWATQGSEAAKKALSSLDAEKPKLAVVPDAAKRESV